MSVSRSANAAVLDSAVLAEIRELGRSIGEDLLADLVRSYCDTARASLRALEQAIEARQASALREAAHALKGSSAHVGAVGVSALARQLEESASEVAASGCTQLVSRLDTELARAVGALEAELATGADAR